MTQPARVLVVDDTPQNIKLLGDLLEAKGYAVSTAACGEEALRRVREDTPDIVLLDVMMPDLTGYEVCARLRADPATALLPIVMVTSLDPHTERVKGIEAGADDFLHKPINQPELFARVRSLLRIRALQREVLRQADELKQWNARLEERVHAQVSELDRMARLKRFFARPVVEAILASSEQTILAPHRREICYVFVDLRGFTAFTDAAEPEEVQRLLAEYHATLGRLVAEHEGTLDRFAGDGILVFFNDPMPVADAPRRAAAMALAMQRAFAPLRARWRKSGYDLDLGIGIAQGFATLGAFGFDDRVDYSAIGGVVNLAARLCDESPGGQVLVDRRMRGALDECAQFEPFGPLTLKGYSHPVPAFVLQSLAD